ncbi:hypothetical protein AB0J64_51590, partial [Nonomuraea sp. NPDC049695]
PFRLLEPDRLRGPDPGPVAWGGVAFAPGTWRRLVGHMLRSYATPGTDVPALADAPTHTALYRAMIRFGRTSPGHEPTTQAGESGRGA